MALHDGRVTVVDLMTTQVETVATLGSGAIYAVAFDTSGSPH